MIYSKSPSARGFQAWNVFLGMVIISALAISAKHNELTNK